jgi:hypothetical protein
MYRRMTKFAKRLVPALLLFAAAWAQCGAQDIPTEIQAARLQVYAGGSGVFTDYLAGKNASLFGGADLVFRPLFTWQPGVEVRATYPIDSRNVDGQFSYLVGPRVEYAYGKFHPYANFLIGTGTIDFRYPVVTSTATYPNKSCLVYGIGLGVDYTVTRKLALRLDAQDQFWNLGISTVSNPSPKLFSIGAVYRFNFSSENR